MFKKQQESINNYELHNGKKEFIKCPNCLSKFNCRFVDDKNCILCFKSLHSDTEKKRINLACKNKKDAWNALLNRNRKSIHTYIECELSTTSW